MTPACLASAESIYFEAIEQVKTFSCKNGQNIEQFLNDSIKTSLFAHIR
jgi:hypothetical protein